MGTDRTIAIVTPAPPRSRSGNRVTALRWTLLLRQLGCRPFLTSEWSGRPAQALLAVHAQKSAASVDAFLRRYPERKVGVLLAGTDLYPEFRPEAQMSRCLEQATILITLQAAAASSLPPTLRDRVRVVVQSARSGPGPRRPDRNTSDTLRVCMLAHLRAVKNPLLPFAAEKLVAGRIPLQIEIAGQAMDDELLTAVTRARTARCRWIGNLPRRQAMALLARSHACLVPSLGEGGANVVSEAIAAGTPLLATAIPGNTGLLGSDWPALFPVDDAPELARLLERVASDIAFFGDLCERTAALQPLVQPAREREALGEVVACLGIDV